MMSYPWEEIPLRSSTSGLTTWSEPLCPGCLKDSPTPQRPFSVLSALSHPMMQHKIYHGKSLERESYLVERENWRKDCSMYYPVEFMSKLSVAEDSFDETDCTTHCKA